MSPITCSMVPSWTLMKVFYPLQGPSLMHAKDATPWDLWSGYFLSFKFWSCQLSFWHLVCTCQFTGSGKLLFVASFLKNGGGSKRLVSILIPKQIPLSARFMRCEHNSSIILYILYFFQVRDPRVCMRRIAVSFYTHNNHYLQMIFVCCGVWLLKVPKNQGLRKQQNRTSHTTYLFCLLGFFSRHLFTRKVIVPLTYFCVNADCVVNCSCFQISFKENKCKHQGLQSLF